MGQDGGVPRSLALVVAWLVAAAASLAVAWQGVGVIGDQVTADRAAPVTPTELATGEPAGSTSTTSDPGSSSTTTTSTPPEAQPVNRTFTVVGGTATLAFTPDGVTLVVATPNAGFEVDTEPENGNGIKVEFESDGHRSRIDGWWDGGPQAETREDPRHSGPG
jgi:hypothetical protein